MAKREYFSQYESPNIVIVPTVSFCGAPASKKMKLSLHVDEVQSRNDPRLEKGTCSSHKLENNCSSSKITNKVDGSNISMATNENLNIIHVNPIKLNRLTHDSGPSDKVLKVSESNEKSSMREETNKKNNLVEKENNKHISISPFELKINIDSKADKDIATNNKNVLKTKTKKSCNSSNKKNNNNEGARLKNAEKEYISSSHKDKKHGKLDEISTHKTAHVSRHSTKEISEKCNKNTCSKISKNKHKHSDKHIKLESHDPSRREKQKRKKSCQDKIRHKSGSENTYLGKTTLMDDTNINYCSKMNDPKKDSKKNHASKCEHTVHKHSDKKDKLHSISKSKHISKTKSTLTNQEKCKIKKASDATKYTNSIISTKCHSKERDKGKKICSTDKSANNKSHKLKSSRSESDHKNKKQIRAISSSNTNHKKYSPDDSYENLTVIVKTQSEKYKNAGSPKKEILTTTHKPNKMKLIINVIVKNSDNDETPTHDDSCTKKEDNISLISNSELSFLDDINIDEIVNFLKQPKREQGTKRQDLIILNKSPEGPIIVVDDDSDVENGTVYNKNNELENSGALRKVEEDDKLKDEKPNKDNIFTTYFSNNYIDLSDDSDSNTSTNNISTLPIANITNREVIEDNEHIIVLDEDDTVETLSTCSTVILDSQMDIEECYDILENEKNSTQGAVYNTLTETKDVNIECTEHIRKTVFVDGTENTETFKDPIEAQLKRIFEMPSSDTFDTDADNIISENNEEAEITFKKEPEVIASLPQNEEQNPVVDKDRRSLDNTPNDIECSTIKEERDIVNTPVKINATVVQYQDPNIDRNVSENVDGSKKTEFHCKEELEEIAALPQNEEQNSVGRNDRASLVNTKSDIACPTMKEIIDIVNTPVKINASVVQCQESNIDNNLSKNVDDATEITFKEEPEEIAALPQNEEQNSVGHNNCASLVNTENDLSCTTLPDTSDFVNTPIRMNDSVLENQESKIDNNLSKNVDDVKETEIITEEKAKEIASFLEKQNSIEHKDSESLDSIKNDVECSTTKKTSDIANTSIKINTTVVQSQEPNIDRPVTAKLLKSVKSEIRKVEEQKLPPVRQPENFIGTLEARMSTFLKTQYTVTSLLHNGTHSRIYECIDKGGFNYALKMLNNIRDRYFMGIQKENMLMSFQKDIPKENLHCVHVLNGFSMCGHWCFLMEYYPKNLLEALQQNNKSFHIDTVQLLSQQLIAAVTILRNNNIVHSDIKPSHILINSNNDRIKLCGFDTAYKIKEAIIDPNLGTVNYRPPEVILGYSSGFSLDVWSSALVMFELATNTKLFPGCHDNDILFKQMCTLGYIPYDMLENSLFRGNHFYGTSFMRRVGFRGEVIKFVDSFKRSNRIHRTLFDAYTMEWSDQRTKIQRSKDLEKLVNFKILLDQMLAIHPKHRLSIEFVYAHPFIYEFTDIC